MSLTLPRGYSWWPSGVDDAPETEIVRLYNSGFAGAMKDEQAEANYHDFAKRTNGAEYGEDLCQQHGLAGAAEGKLSVPFIWAADALGVNPWPGSAQARGDCVSHGTRNMAALTALVEVYLQTPDEETGKIEGIPEMPDAGKADGFLSSEGIYWWRRHGGDGWSCDHAAQVLSTESGMWLRKNYPEFGFDLTRYNGKTAGKWGRSTPPSEIKTAGMLHPVRRTTPVKTWEAAADFLNNGNGVNSCGGQSWSDTRDENGYSPTSRGGWAHSEAYLGVDWRPWVQEKYGVPALFAMQNSWAKWNTGPRDIHDSAQFVPAEKKAFWESIGLVNPQTGNLMIPHGCRWVSCKTLNSRSLYAAAGASGWARKRLPNWGFNFGG